ncbi:hypothetical protein TorRG33x02_301840 [Trema orientale]|uniref:Uncharacterized protein n=1 Tax=Trema orientale TaxID=63057 RepID=A0A2P5C0W2_TREOI|nr:hypothetical protein TorRG33x02_301840 [Trema orientale]
MNMNPFALRLAGGISPATPIPANHPKKQHTYQQYRRAAGSSGDYLDQSGPFRRLLRAQNQRRKRAQRRAKNDVVPAWILNLNTAEADVAGKRRGVEPGQRRGHRNLAGELVIRDVEDS